MFIIELLSRIFSMFTPSVWCALIVCFTLVLLCCLALLLSRRGERILTRIIKAAERYSSSRKLSDAHILIQISAPDHSCSSENKQRHETLLHEYQVRSQGEHQRRGRKKFQRQRRRIRRKRYQGRQARRRVHGAKLMRKY